MNKFFLGIDIGFDRCGYCILEYDEKTRNQTMVSAGCIVTDRKLSIAQRLKVLQEDLAVLKQKYSPDYVGIEKLFFYRKNPTFEKVCMSKGLAMAMFSECGISEIEPSKMKKYICGNGSAKKAEVKNALEKILNRKLDKTLDDTVDAIALAMYQCDLYKLKLL